jgi:hypothetical protein
MCGVQPFALSLRTAEEDTVPSLDVFVAQFSARSRNKSICSCVTGLAPAPVNLPAADNFTQLRSVFSTNQTKLLSRQANRFPLLYMLDHPFLKLGRVFLLRNAGSNMKRNAQLKECLIWTPPGLARDIS